MFTVHIFGFWTVFRAHGLQEGGHVTGARAAAQQHNTLLSEVCCGGNMRLQVKGSLHMADNPKAQKQDAGLMFQHKACSSVSMSSQTLQKISHRLWSDEPREPDLRHRVAHELEHDLPQRADAGFALQLADPGSHLACSAIPENLQPHSLHITICF